MIRMGDFRRSGDEKAQTCSRLRTQLVLLCKKLLGRQLGCLMLGLHLSLPVPLSITKL